MSENRHFGCTQADFDSLSHYGFLSDKLSVAGFREMLMWLRVFFVRGHSSPQLPPPPNWSAVLRKLYSNIVLGSFLPNWWCAQCSIPLHRPVAFYVHLPPVR